MSSDRDIISIDNLPANVDNSSQTSTSTLATLTQGVTVQTRVTYEGFKVLHSDLTDILDRLANGELNGDTADTSGEPKTVEDPEVVIGEYFQEGIGELSKSLTSNLKTLSTDFNELSGHVSTLGAPLILMSTNVKKIIDQSKKDKDDWKKNYVNVQMTKLDNMNKSLNEIEDEADREHRRVKKRYLAERTMRLVQNAKVIGIILLAVVAFEKMIQGYGLIFNGIKDSFAGIEDYFKDLNFGEALSKMSTDIAEAIKSLGESIKDTTLTSIENLTGLSLRDTYDYNSLRGVHRIKYLFDTNNDGELSHEEDVALGFVSSSGTGGKVLSPDEVETRLAEMAEYTQTGQKWVLEMLQNEYHKGPLLKEFLAKGGSQFTTPQAQQSAQQYLTNNTTNNKTNIVYGGAGNTEATR